MSLLAITPAPCAMRCGRTAVQPGEVWYTAPIARRVGGAVARELRALCPACAATFVDDRARHAFLARAD